MVVLLISPGTLNGNPCTHLQQSEGRSVLGSGLAFLREDDAISYAHFLLRENGGKIRIAQWDGQERAVIVPPAGGDQTPFQFVPRSARS